LLIIQNSIQEDALYYKFDSAYQLGINSVPKNGKRLNVAKTAYLNLVKFNAKQNKRETMNLEMLIETAL
jgi:outer membrane protein assembly factor BamD